MRRSGPDLVNQNGPNLLTPGPAVRDIAFCADVYRFPRSKEYDRRVLGCLLWALIYANEAYLQGTPDKVPALYASGIHWEEEVPLGRSACPSRTTGQELFLGIGQIREQGHADCEDVVAWRCSELRLGRVPPTPGLPPFPGHPPVTAFKQPYKLRSRGPAVLPGYYSRVTGPQQITLHIVVCWPGGRIEDPSRVLGMGGARRYG